MKNWEILKADIEKELANIATKEPEDVYRMRTNTVGNEAGSYGYYWAAWDFDNGMIRDLSSMVMYPILKLGYSENFDLQQLKEVTFGIHPLWTNYMGYSGFKTLKEFDVRYREVFDELETKEEWIELYTAFLKYANKLCAWVFHYFAWEVGKDWVPTA